MRKTSYVFPELGVSLGEQVSNFCFFRLNMTLMVVQL